MLRQVASLCGTPVVLSTLGFSVCAALSMEAKLPNRSGGVVTWALEVEASGNGASGKSAAF